MDEVEEVKSKIDIVDLVGKYVSLKKAGINFKGLCPFHHERTASFMVNPERQIFKCFGCNKGGDVFTFLQEIEGIEFGDALKILAEQTGVTLKPRHVPLPGQAPSEKSRYYLINGIATSLWNKILTTHPVGKEALDYLHGRGITNQTIEAWRIGYAPRKKVLTDVLIKKGLSPSEIVGAGKPDMFYDRIMFPITDIIGNVIAFTGRVLHEGEPKYLNTPETVIFHKSRILFGLDRARRTIKEQKQVILAEGQMDVIAATQAGTTNVVATSGTALTVDHLRILARYDADIVFAFDADGAGIQATKKAIELAILDDLNVKVIPMSKPYKDIGEIVQKDPTAWLGLAKKPIPAIEWQIQTVYARYVTNGVARKLAADEKKQIAKELLPVIAQIPNAIEQAHYIQVLAKRLGVNENVIQQAIKPRSLSKSLTLKTTSSQQLTVKEILLGLLELSLDNRKNHMELYNKLKKEYDTPIDQLMMVVEQEYKGLSPGELRAEIELLIKRQQDSKQEELKSDFANRIGQAESQGDREEVKKLLAEFQQLLK